MAHRQFVFIIPKRLRLYFRFDRRLLGELCRAAWPVVQAVYAAAADQSDAVPGMIGAIQTFGDLIHWHPHIAGLSGRGDPAPAFATAATARQAFPKRANI